MLRATTNLWQSRIAFEIEAGETLLAFKSGGIVHLSAELEIEPAAWKWAELPPIVMLDWNLLVMMMKSDSAVAAAGAAGQELGLDVANLPRYLGALDSHGPACKRVYHRGGRA